jgi:hypothetical protein
MTRVCSMIWLMAMKGLNSENVQHFIGLVSRSTVSILGVPLNAAPKLDVCCQAVLASVFLCNLARPSLNVGYHFAHYQGR